MTKPRSCPAIAALCLALYLTSTHAFAHDARQPAPPPNADDIAAASAEMAAAAKNLWDALTPEQQQAIGFAFDDAERLNWHFIPRPRKGLPWAQMNTTQRYLAHVLLSSGLSSRGYGEAASIMSLEEILKGIEQGKGPVRDPENYYFSVFGKPGAEGTWGWRVEGHHVALNFTVANGKGIAGAPAFFGSNPGEVRDGPRKGLRILAAEEDIGLRLVRTLDDDQKKKAVFSDKAPNDIVTGNKRPAVIDQPLGITYAELKPEQQAMLRMLVNVYAHRLRDEIAHADLAKIDAAGWDKVRFAWAGGTEPGVGHYYRLHGPTFLVELDNTQNNANHVHTVWRDFTNDFGEDLLKAHYEKEHAAAK